MKYFEQFLSIIKNLERPFILSPRIETLNRESVQEIGKNHWDIVHEKWARSCFKVSRDDPLLYCSRRGEG